jgi:Ser/Thr protein kinase RdoA (MazF antagonist)
MRPYAERHDLTLLQLACAWNLAHEAVHCVVPTLIQESGASAKAVEAKRAELAAVPAGDVLSAAEVDELRAIGDNTGSMVLKGAAPDFDGEPLADRWPLSAELEDVAARWRIVPEKHLAAAPA